MKPEAREIIPAVTGIADLGGIASAAGAAESCNPVARFFWSVILKNSSISN
ncbi:MAG TPA: hypothetical protein VG892_03840 [Terriglobales bacterium]|jgi:hypothetical protein|nr:hypothetical protein [Terriglobales bacterium]